MARITLSLISHTNVGKTTLARTLLRRDVGEVFDQAHVTETAEAFPLIEAGGHELILWDTPGFGDSARLMKLLRRQREPLGWLLHQVWDRIVDRPLYCSQLAARNVRDEADVVLYLVNAAEDPDDAGYVRLELELLEWLGRPVLLLLNQIGPDGRAASARWEELARGSPVVRGAVSLDAFTRCWVEEGVLLRRIGELLGGEASAAMDALTAAWNARNLGWYREAVDAMAAFVTAAALDREEPAPGATAGGDDGAPAATSALRSALRVTGIDRRRATAALDRRLDRATAELMDRLIATHGLEGRSDLRIEQQLRDYRVRGHGLPLNERTGAVAGAAVSGALSGLAADVLSGGLTLGGGMIAGGILGALGGYALGRGYRLVGGGERVSVRWSAEFLDRLCAESLLRYLSVAHFGRGRGTYRDVERPAHWIDSVERALAPRRDELHALWQAAHADAPDAERRVRDGVRAVLDAAARGILRDRYPDASL